MMETAIKKTNKAPLYLGLTLVGAAVPLDMFIMHFMQFGTDFNLFLQHAFPNLVASGLTSDLIISSMVFWLFASSEMDKHGISRTKLPLFIVLNLFIGLSCALPAFFWWREKHIEA